MIHIATLRAAGLSSEDIVRVIAADQAAEAECAAERRERHRQAQRRYVEKTKQNQSSRDRNDNHDNHDNHPSPPSSPPSNGFPTPLPFLPPLTPPTHTALRAAPVSDWPNDFREQFWTRYPRHTEKKACMKKLEAIQRTGKISWATLLAGIERYVKHIAGVEERYVKHPTTWLNRGCWDDQFACEPSLMDRPVGDFIR